MTDESGPTLLDHWRLLCRAACDPQLARGDVAVLCVILQQVDRWGSAYPGPARIATQAHIDRRSVKRSLLKLEAAGYLQIERPGDRVRNVFWPVFV